MSTPLDTIIGEIEAYAVGDELVLYHRRCRRQLARISGSVTITRQVAIAHEHRDCPVFGDVLAEALSNLEATARGGTGGP